MFFFNFLIFNSQGAVEIRERDEERAKKKSQKLTADDPERVDRRSADDARDLRQEVHVPLRRPDLSQGPACLGPSLDAVPSSSVHRREERAGRGPRSGARREPKERERDVEHGDVPCRVELGEEEAAVDASVHRGPDEEHGQGHRGRPEAGDFALVFAYVVVVVVVVVLLLALSFFASYSTFFSFSPGVYDVSAEVLERRVDGVPRERVEY